MKLNWNAEYRAVFYCRINWMPVLKNLCGLSVEFASVCRQFQELRRRDLKVWGTALLAVYSLCKISLFFFYSLVSLYAENCVTRQCWNVAYAWRVLFLFLLHLTTCIMRGSCSCFGRTYCLNLNWYHLPKRRTSHQCETSYFSKCHYFYISGFVMCN